MLLRVSLFSSPQPDKHDCHSSTENDPTEYERDDKDWRGVNDFKDRICFFQHRVILFTFDINAKREDMVRAAYVYDALPYFGVVLLNGSVIDSSLQIGK